MNENLKLIGTIVAALVIYNYFVARRATDFLDDVFHDESKTAPENGLGDTIIDEMGNGTTVSAVSETLVGAGQDNQATITPRQVTTLLRS
jgi:hypothetical protein